MPRADPEEDDLWWGKSLKMNRHHIFNGKGAMPGSLCGNWMLNYDGNDPDVSPDDTYTEGQDCKACCRNAGLLEDD